MGSMFYGATAFNQPLVWDTSSVTTMGAMLSGAAAFDQPFSLDTSSVTGMAFKFWYACPLATSCFSC